MRRRALLATTATVLATPLVAGCTRDGGDGGGEDGDSGDGDGDSGGGGPYGMIGAGGNDMAAGGGDVAAGGGDVAAGEADGADPRAAYGRSSGPALGPEPREDAEDG